MGEYKQLVAVLWDHPEAGARGSAGQRVHWRIYDALGAVANLVTCVPPVPWPSVKFLTQDVGRAPCGRRAAALRRTSNTTAMCLPCSRVLGRVWQGGHCLGHAHGHKCRRPQVACCCCCGECPCARVSFLGHVGVFGTPCAGVGAYPSALSPFCSSCTPPRSAIPVCVWRATFVSPEAGGGGGLGGGLGFVRGLSVVAAVVLCGVSYCPGPLQRNSLWQGSAHTRRTWCPWHPTKLLQWPSSIRLCGSENNL